MNTQQRMKPKLGTNLVSCSALMILMFVVFGIGSAFCISKIGFIHIPYFSNLYEGPHPTRIVQNDVLAPSELYSKILSRIQQDAISHPAGPFTASVSEKELSSTLNTSVTNSMSVWRAKNVQVVIQPNGLEIFGAYGVETHDIHFLATAIPFIENGLLRIKIQSLQIGDMHIPSFSVTSLMSLFFNAELNISFGNTSLHDLRLHDGTADITLEKKS